MGLIPLDRLQAGTAGINRNNSPHHFEGESHG